ncbi:MAG: PEP-CTERM sorting domain-containing protein [Kiritimatiellaeota bacterium]|nr:PEP-CTERM sorting domain-containing protein [Kiritimatiellota bacterium]
MKKFFMTMLAAGLTFVMQAGEARWDAGDVTEGREIDVIADTHQDTLDALVKIVSQGSVNGFVEALYNFTVAPFVDGVRGVTLSPGELSEADDDMVYAAVPLQDPHSVFPPQDEWVTIPEPSVMSLLVMGATVMLLRRKRPSPAR